jgi:hypothetical protein
MYDSGIEGGVSSGLGLGATKKKKSSTGMDTMDWVGMGMSIAGAIANQQEEENARKLSEDQFNQSRADSLRLGAQNRQDTLKQNAIQNRQQDRSQNQAGLNYMTSLVDSNAAAAKKRVPSFRQTMLSGGF